MVDKAKIRHAIKSSIEQCLKISIDKVPDDAEFSSLGLDSIVAMELIGTLSKKIGYTLTPVVFASANNIPQLVNHIEPLLTKESPSNNGDTQEFSDDAVLSNTDAIKTSEIAENNRGDNKSVVDAIKYVNDNYNIDLSPFQFDSVDDVADLLVAEYGVQMANEFGLPKVENSSAYSRESKTYSNAKPKDKSVSITGIACRLPNANNHLEFFENLLAKKVSLKRISNKVSFSDRHVAVSDCSGEDQFWGAKIDDVESFDYEYFGIDPNEAHLIDPQERLLLQEVCRAIEDAGIGMSTLSGSNTGVFVGHEYSEYEAALRGYSKVIDNLPPFTTSQTSFYLANRISHVFNLKGPSETFNVNCVSSSLAINRAFHALISGECETALVCGVSLNLFDSDFRALTGRGLLSPSGTCDVFGDGANGYTRGEGVAVIVLELCDSVKNNGRRVYANIKASCQRNRGSSSQLSEIKHEAISEVVSAAYENANIEPHRVSYVEVNGYSTKWGDSFEFEGLKSVFATSAHREKHCALGSLKANIGHLEPASGIVSLIKVALSLFHGRFPPTITSDCVSSFIDILTDHHPLYIAKEELKAADARVGNFPIVAAVNSFADSGVNVHLVLEEELNQLSNPEVDESKSRNVFLLSARDHDSLLRYVRSFLDYLKSSDDDSLDLSAINHTLQCGRDYLESRLAIVAGSVKALREKLKITLKEGAEEDSAALGKHSIYVGSSQQRSSLEKYISNEMVEFQVKTSQQQDSWDELCVLWANGVFADWKCFWHGANARFVSLPAYPFKKTECWATHYRPGVESDVDNADELRIVSSGDESVSNSTERNDSAAIESPDDNAYRLMSKLSSLLSSVDQKDISSEAYTDSFHSLGVSSMAVVKLLQTLNSELDINLSPVEIIENDSIFKICYYLLEKYGDRIGESGFIKDCDFDNNKQDNVCEIESDASAIVDSESEEPGIVEVLNFDESLLDDVIWQENVVEKEYDKTTF